MREFARLHVRPGAGSTPLLLYPEGALELSAEAHAIVEACDGQRTLPEIARVLAERFDGDPAAITEDVRALLEELAGRGLVVFDREAEG